MRSTTSAGGRPPPTGSISSDAVTFTTAVRGFFALLLASLLLASLSAVPGVSCWVHPPAFSTRRAISTSSRLHSSEAGEEGLAGKTLYQRTFYRWSPRSDVAVHDAVVVEERMRFRPSLGADEGSVVPTGHRTIILRHGNVEDGEIGDDFFAMDVHEPTSTSLGGFEQSVVQSSIAAAMYLASNPDLVHHQVLEVSCELGLAGLLGAIGAGAVSRRVVNTDAGADADQQSDKHDATDDVLTVPHDYDHLFPAGLELLTLTDDNDASLDLVFDNVKNSGVAPSKVAIEKYDWKARGQPPSRGGAPSNERQYDTIVASDVASTYPEAQRLARAVAHKLKPSSRSVSSYSYSSSSSPPTPSSFSFDDPTPSSTSAAAESSSSSSSKSSPETTRVAPPTFVHVTPDPRDDVPELHRLLERGYRMAVNTGYLLLEKLTFAVQALPSSADESDLDDLELELKHLAELPYQSLTAVHHPDYVGEGTGELFFPVETGADEEAGAGTYLERDYEQGGGMPWYSPEA